MRRYKRESLLGVSTLGLLILAGGAARAASLSINFDVLPDGTPFPAQPTFAATAGPLREEYKADGVHFMGGGGVLTGSFGVSGFSGANFLAFNIRPAAAYANGTGPVPLPPEQITFDQPADLVKLNVGSPEAVPGTATLTAYDANGNVVGTAQLALSAQAGPLQVQSPSYNIVSVQLALTGSRSMAAGDLVAVLEDQANVPPVTECVLSGPGGANGWYVGDVQATLTATDADGSVVSTQYSLDGGDWQLYSAPVAISGDGVHTLQFKSLDRGGLWEDVKAETISIDTTKPVVSLSLSRHTVRAVHDHDRAHGKDPESSDEPDADEMVPVVVNGSATDAGSGLASVQFEVKDKYGRCQPALDSFGQPILLEATVDRGDRSGRWYKVTATATDKAGLQTSVSQWVVVVPHGKKPCEGRHGGRR